MEYMSPVEEYLYSETLNRAGHERWYSYIRMRKLIDTEADGVQIQLYGGMYSNSIFFGIAP